MKIKSVSLLVVAIVLITTSTAVAKPRSQASEPEFPAEALGTAFTYQGQLFDSGNPAAGQYDLRFSLYDAANAGNLIGTVNQDDVLVSSGIFTVPLDFGAVFNGTAYWLEIGVRPGASSGAYTALDPRQPITAAPYALYAQAVGPHNHLGQIWNSSNNPLIVNGSYTGSTSTSGAPLILTNTAGDGLRIQQAGTPPGSSNESNSNGIEVAGAQSRGLYVGRSGDDGVYVAQAGTPTGGSVTSAIPNGLEIARAEGHGVFVGNADNDGMRIYQAGEDGVNIRSSTANGVLIETVGSPSTTNASSAADGVEIQGAQGNGLFIGQANADGVHIRRAGTPTLTGSTSTSANGVEIVNVQGYGIFISRADLDGLRINLAGDDGLDVSGNDFAGVFAGSISVSGGCVGCSAATFAVNTGTQPLYPGDIVAVQGMETSAFDNAASLMQVVPANASLPIIGVVAGNAEIDTQQEPLEGMSGVRLVPRSNAAMPGEYVTVIYSGLVQLRAAAPLAIGDKLTVDSSGNVRGLLSTEVNGIRLTEDAPVVGIVLSQPENGLVWVLVNPR